MPHKSSLSSTFPKLRLSSLTAYYEVLQDDNDDYCSSCGGNGQLICCDGCTRSFHFSCVDPPLVQGAMPDEWFCNVCRTAHNPPVFPVYSGPFASLMEKLEAKNSSAFALPLDVREYFEAVRTGQDGEYEEIVPLVKPPAKYVPFPCVMSQLRLKY